MASVCRPGGSYSRTTSSPRRALERQWMRRSESPGRYSRIPNSSLPEPALGAAALASSSRTWRRPASEANRGSTSATSESEQDRRPRKKPRGSLVPIVQSLAPTGPRLSSLRTFIRVQPFVGTTPVANLTCLPLMRPFTHAGPRAPPLVRSPTARSRASFSKTGAACGLVRRTESGSASAGESAAGRDLSTPRWSVSPARFHSAYAPHATTRANNHAASRNSHDTSEVAPYHSRTSHSASAPTTRQVGLTAFSSVLAQGRDRQCRNDLRQHLRCLAATAHAQPVRDHGRGQQLDVVRNDEVATLEQSPRLSGALQVDTRPHARRQQDVRTRADRVQQPDDVGANRRRRDDAKACFLQLDDLADFDHRGQLGDGVAMLPAGQHFQRFGIRRRTHLGRQHEAVELRLGQRVCAVELGGILRRDDEEGGLEDASGALDGHLALPHRFEQGRLGPRRRAVYLVGEHDVGKDRSGDEFEAQVFLIEDARSRDVRGKQVGRALDAPEGAADRCGKRSRQHRLACAREVLQQNVTARDEPSQRQPDDALLADDDAMDAGFDAVEKLRGAPGLNRGFLHWRSSLEGGWRASAR